MLYLVLLVLGIVTLVRGKIEIAPRRHVVETRARYVGIALIATPLVIVGTTTAAAAAGVIVLDQPGQANVLVAGVRALEWVSVGIFAVLLHRLATPILAAAGTP